MAALTSSLIAAGVAAAASGTAAGIAGHKRRKAERKQRRILDGMSKDNENMFMKDYYQDTLDDPTTRSYLKRISSDLQDRNKGIENSGISTGATHENVLAQKQSNNEVMSDAMNNVVVNQEQKKAAAKERYLGRKNAIASGNMELAARSGEQQAQNWSNLGNNMSDSVTGLASSYLQSGGGLLKSGPLLNAAGLNSVTNKSKAFADSLKPKLAF